MLFCRSDYFQNQVFEKDYFRNTNRVSNSLNSDQAPQFVEHNLSGCKLFAYFISRPHNKAHGHLSNLCLCLMAYPDGDINV